MVLESQLLDLVVRYEELREQGLSPTPEDLCRDCPEWLPAVRRHVRGLEALDSALESDDAEVSTVSEPGSRVPALPPSSGRYRPLRFHAGGGLGEVFLAEDEDLRRRVALKRMKVRALRNPDSAVRFLREAELTGQLEHPGVVPVYGLGRDEGGQPFYVMRFIEGTTFADAIVQFHKSRPADPSERNLGFRQLLTRFVAMCNTVAYAHSVGVLHRDLKPANTMLGPYGETLVVDWGLAKRMTPGCDVDRAGQDSGSDGGAADETQVGRVMGTPAYMSPEQANGRWDCVGPRSDVYSLGATFYTLLTGEPPFADSDEHTVLGRVQRGALTPPRQRRGDVPPALEAICLRAMALRPEDRYETALALASDLDHWLADEPVDAYREPWRERARRWLRRHRTLAVSLAAATGVALAALLVVVVLLGAKNRELTRANEAEHLAKARADERFRLAHSAVEEMLTEVGLTTLAEVPHADPIRRRLLERAVKFFERLLTERDDDPILRSEVGRACRHAAEINAFLGRFDDAERCYRRGEELMAEADRAASPGQQLEWARLQASQGWFLRLLKRSDEGKTQVNQAIERLQSLHENEPDRADVNQELARALNHLGLLSQDLRDREGAEQALGRALAMREQLYEGDPRHDRYCFDLATSLNNLGNLYARQKGHEDEAIRLHERGRELRQELVRRRQRHPEALHQEAMSHDNLGVLYGRIGAVEAAWASFGDALRIQTPLAKDHPDRADFATQLGRIQSNLGVALADEELWEEAVDNLTQAVTTLTPVVMREPRHALARHCLHLAYQARAICLEALQRHDEAQADREQVAKFAPRP